MIRSAQFQCNDCLGVDMYCQECVVSRHASNPLHRLKKWNDKYFQNITLKELGLNVQLGHPIGERCRRPHSTSKDGFVVVHNNGIHIVSLAFCGCEATETHYRQLLRMRWLPATSDRPHTAATFHVLGDFHLVSLESKLSCYDFYNALARHTDNTGLNPPKARYEQFLRLVQQWRHIKMLKRSGRGHDPAGISNTKEGECAVLCPACPQPGKNTVVLSSASDPSLSQGWAYFVEDSAFKQYLYDHKNDIQEKSTCSNHNAVNLADVKKKKGCDATGVGMVVCARHGMRLPNGVADLQYGERYVNMDYTFALALHHSDVNVLKVSYDIACQWHKKLYQWMDNMPHSHQLSLRNRSVSFLVPKFHLPTHISSCQWSFSFNWTKGVGRTDGEEPERGWANLNAAASSTKDMGPGHRRDTLDDYMGDWNWKKLEAIPECNEHRADFEELTRLLELKFPDQLALWKQQVEEWENDPSKPNPFEVKNDGITQASVCLQLAKEEARQSDDGSEEFPLHPDITPNILISTGIDLEEQQQQLCDATKLGSRATDTQQARIQQRSNLLLRHIEAWQQVQVLFIPSVGNLRSGSDSMSQPPSAEDIALFLPSQIDDRASCPCPLSMIEFRLREGQAHDVLNDLCQGLRSRAYMLKFKDRFLRGQGSNTWARNCVKALDTKINAAATRYRVAYLGWRSALHPLADDIISSLSIGYDLCPGEGRRRVSWIWQVCGYGEQATDNESDDGFQEAIRVEWCRAQARAHRWEEEVALSLQAFHNFSCQNIVLLEEMQRTLQFLEWHSKWWMDRLSEGRHAYAKHQAELHDQIRQSFAHMWRDTKRFLEFVDITGAEGSI
ncbi:hypothetical protein EDC04DRAFT_2867093 [Pisolithus marmoratus]|nr:hypothetical protein EDC04DRAFT_2867093 [Pisolithus marmoratus]